MGHKSNARFQPKMPVKVKREHLVVNGVVKDSRKLRISDMQGSVPNEAP